MIEFLCPNGHRIRCPAEQAGRAAKCPRCGVKFRVPEAADVTLSNVTDSDSGVSRPEFTDSDISAKKSGSSVGKAEREPPIEFLCPNGHRLFGAASLQGKAGKCPECGSRFRIPTREEAAASHDAGIASDQAALTLGGTVPVQPFSADVLERLWKARPEGGTIEIHLRDGTKLAPEQFLRSLSPPACVAVTSSEPDGRKMLSIVACDAIARVVIGGLKELPPSLGGNP